MRAPRPPDSIRVMAFKETIPQFQIVDLAVVDPDPKHVRQNISEESLRGLTNAIGKLGILHPIIVRPAPDNRYVVIAGERRRQAALQAGETRVPVLVRPCTEEEAQEVRVFENLGLGVRSALEPRDMANAIQAIAERFASPDEAAQYFGRAPTWLTQATAAANLSEKVSALLESGKIASTGAAVQLEKLARKDEAKAESLIEQIEQLPEGEKVSKKAVDAALSQASGRQERSAEPEPAPLPVPVPQPVPREAATAAHAEDIPPWEDAPEDVPATTPPPSSPRTNVSPAKVKRVAELLGLSEEDPEAILERLIDEFLAAKQA